MLHIIWCVSTRETQWNQRHVCISLQSKVIGKSYSWLEIASKWPQVTLQRSQIKHVMLWARKTWNMTVWIAIGQIGHYGWVSMHYLISPVFQWRGHDIIADLRSPNRKIVDMHFVIVHGLAPHARFQNPYSKTVGPSEGQSWHAALQLTLSGDITWPDLDLKMSPVA